LLAADKKEVKIKNLEPEAALLKLQNPSSKSRVEDPTLDIPGL
jgi:hypothetical protein